MGVVGFLVFSAISSSFSTLLVLIWVTVSNAVCGSEVTASQNVFMIVMWTSQSHQNISKVLRVSRRPIIGIATFMHILDVLLPF